MQRMRTGLTALLGLELPTVQAPAGYAAPVEEREPEDRLRDARTRDDFADYGHVFSRHAGDQRRCRRGSGERPILATTQST